MGRNLGPKHKLCRRLGVKICDSQKCPAVRRNYPAGVHGPSQGATRIRRSEYGKQLLEKQKAKATYGILERQFRNYFEKAKKDKKATDKSLLQLLERRIDNVIFRAGFAQTRAQARQLVSHGHFIVNDRGVTIPSFQIKQGDEIKAKKINKKYFEKLKEYDKKTEIPSWIRADLKNLTIKIGGLPKDEELPKNINAKLIIEFYSR